MTNSKETLRQKMRKRLAALSPEEGRDWSAGLRSLLTFPAGSRVALFAGTAREPQLLDLITTSPEVSWFLPKVTGPGEMRFIACPHSSALRCGSFGIMEPPHGPPASALDVIVCPGLAFTAAGHRLGQGGGYYDRLLPDYPGARTLGVAFPPQILPELPREDHDVVLDAVLTPPPEP